VGGVGVGGGGGGGNHAGTMQGMHGSEGRGGG
jgi:hypothetical protein